MSTVNSLNTQSTLEVDGKSYQYHSLPKAAEQLKGIEHLPKS